MFCRSKKWELIALLAYTILASLAVLYFKPVYIISILVVLVPPSLMNFLWLEHSRKRVFWFAFFATIFFAPPIELMARIPNVWDVQSIFFRPFGLIPLENMIFAFLNFFWVLSFYEYFVDKSIRLKGCGRLKYLIALYIIFASAIFGLYIYDSRLIGASYFTIAVITLIIPGILIFGHNPKLLKKTIVPTIFFALIFFIYELVSLKIGSWYWPGDYLLSFKVFGQPFPVDDIIIWYFISTPALIGGYEYFSDDYK